MNKVALFGHFIIHLLVMLSVLGTKRGPKMKMHGPTFQELII